MSDDIIEIDQGGDNNISVILRTADQTRKAEVEVSKEDLISEIIASAIENWQLDKEVDYSISNVTQSISLDPDQTIGGTNTSNGDTLEIQPVLVAGYGW